MLTSLEGVGAWELAVVAVLLSLERLTYLAVLHAPSGVVRACAAMPVMRLTPVDAVTVLFAAFKLNQLLVFAWWWMRDGHGLRPASAEPGHLAIGSGLVVLGQVLNLSVFRRLGRVGVFYGRHFGQAVRWRRGFPFSWFRHPQYVGTSLSIWGAFVVMRYPAPDWLLVPLLETVYYILGAWLEAETPEPSTAHQ